jgi:hypothetical protein
MFAAKEEKLPDCRVRYLLAFSLLSRAKARCSKAIGESTCVIPDPARAIDKLDPAPVGSLAIS